MIVDLSTHLVAEEVAEELSGHDGYERLKRFFLPETSDPEARIGVMSKYGIDMQVLSLPISVLSGLGSEKASRICKISNDAIGKICLWYPDRFIPLATVSLLDVDDASREMERAVKLWGCRGVALGTKHDNRYVDDPLYEPFFEKVSKYDIPLFLHPTGFRSSPLLEEDPYLLRLFGWSFETTEALLRLVLSGTLERFPSLRVVLPHLGGGVIPFFSRQFLVEFPYFKKKNKRPLTESLQRVYADTAVGGTKGALLCGHAFFGSERMLFGTGYPLSPGNGELYVKENLEVIKAWDLPEREKSMILGENAARLLRIGS